MIRIESHKSASDFKGHTQAFLMQREAENCVIIGLIETMLADPNLYKEPMLLSIHDGDTCVGASWRTPPHPLGLTTLNTESTDALYKYLIDQNYTFPTVFGPRPTIDQFVEAWTSQSQQKISRRMHQRIYSTTSSHHPFPPTGRLRLADARDLDLLRDWSSRFATECHLGSFSEDFFTKQAQTAINNKSRFLWEVDGRVVSMVGSTGKTPNGIRIGYVYTPHEFRGKGYASMAVAQLTQDRINAGNRFCFLYTDLDNPTSNSIYQRIGYRPIGDSMHVTFENLNAHS